MILYDYVLSASCYKIRLMAALMGVKLDLVAVDFHPGREHKGAALLALNPGGTLPVMVVDGVVLIDTSAMLIQLTQGTEWRGAGNEWFTMAGSLNASLGMARLHDMLHFPADIKAVRAEGIQHLRKLEEHLTERRLSGQIFLTADRATIADIACFPNVALAPDGGVSLDDYPSIRLWLRAIRSLPGFIEMPGIHRLHELKPGPFDVGPGQALESGN
jgi:glutathione S-transferase